MSKVIEVEEGPDMAVPGEDFLEEFGSFLHTHQLGDVIGISTLPPSEEQWVETVLADGQGTVARPIPRGQAICARSFAISSCETALITIIFLIGPSWNI